MRHLLDEAEDRHREELETLSRRHAETLRTLQDDWQQTASCAQHEAVALQRRLTAVEAAAASGARVQPVSDRDARVAAAISPAEREAEHAAHADELEAVRQEHEATLNGLAALHEAAIADVSKAHSAEIARLEARHKVRIHTSCAYGLNLTVLGWVQIQDIMCALQCASPHQHLATVGTGYIHVRSQGARRRVRQSDRSACRG